MDGGPPGNSRWATFLYWRREWPWFEPSQVLGRNFFSASFSSWESQNTPERGFSSIWGFDRNVKIFTRKKISFFFQSRDAFSGTEPPHPGTSDGSALSDKSPFGAPNSNRSRGSVHRKKSIFLSFASRDQGSSSGWDHQFFQTFRFSF